MVASFDIDAFYDYRARRPPMTFTENRYEDYEPPRLVVRLNHDSLGTPYLLLHGPEPDTHWEAFALAVRAVVEHFRVRLTVSMGAVPMAVPHTRPVMLTNHATVPDLLLHENIWKGQIRVPASAQSLLELRLGEWGHAAMGFVAHIPHYVAQFDYPSAAATMLESVEVVTGLQWDLADVEAAGEAKMVEIAAQIEDSDEVRDVVPGLEQQYDAFHRPDEEGDALPLAEETRPADGRGARRRVRAVPGRPRPAQRPPRRRRVALCPAPPTSSSSCSTSRPSTSTCSAARSPTPCCSGCSAARSPAQALVAGARTVEPPLSVHSLHSYFLRPGDTAVPIVYDVERIRDGRSFSTRRVVARQHGRPIYFMTASFQVPEEGFDHQDVMPDVPSPAESLGHARGRPRAGRPRAPTSGCASGRPWRCAAVGDSRPGGRLPNDEHPAQARLWIRVSGTLDDEVLTHQAAFTYASDMTLLGSSLVPHGVHDRQPEACRRPRWTTRIWFHRPFRADEWLLYDQVSPSASRCPRARVRPGVHRGRPAGRHGRPGGPDPPRA